MNDARFAGRLDLTRVGVFGHSFGESQALQFCHDDPRCKAGVDIDDGALLKSSVFRAILRVDGRRQLALTAQYLRGFFDAHL